MADIKRTLEVEILAVADKFAAGMAQASKSLTGFESSLGRTFGQFDKTEAGLQNIGRAGAALQGPLLGAGAALTAFGAAGTAALGLAGNAAKDFETAFTGVRKTVEASPAEFAALEQGIRGLALEIPVAADELARIGEIAGQLGVSKDGILDFTETIAALGVTTNLSTEEAAVGLARFINISDATQAEVSNLGSAIVALGNNSATSEKEILNMATRMALAGTQAGLSSEEILAFSASLSSAGVSAELGGTNFSKFISAINSGVIAGGSSLQQFAQIVGTTAADFKQKFETDAAGAITLLLSKMGEFSTAGGDMAGLLDDLGFKGEETQRAILALSTRTGELTSSLNLSKSAFSENIALTREAELRYATTESQMAIFSNTIRDIGISIGAALLPALNEALGAVRPMVAEFADFAREHSTVVAAIAAITAGASALALGLGGITAAAGLMAGSISTLLPLLGGASGLAGGLAAVATAMTGPVGITVAALAVGTGLATLITKFGDTKKDADVTKMSAEELRQEIARLGGEVDKQANGETWTAYVARLQETTTGLRNARDMQREYARGFLQVSQVHGVAEESTAQLKATQMQLVEALAAGRIGVDEYRAKMKEAEATYQTAIGQKGIGGVIDALVNFNKEAPKAAAEAKNAGDAVSGMGSDADTAEQKTYNLQDAIRIANAEFAHMENMARNAALAMSDDLDTAAVDLTASIADTTAAMVFWGQTAADTWDSAAMQAATTANEVKEAFRAMGVSTKAELDQAAADAERNFDLISGSGQASAQAIDQAWIKMLEARKAALIANGSDLGVEEQKMLDDLLARQRTHATDTKTVWDTWADGLKGVVEGLDIGGKIFSGAFAPGRWKQTLKDIAGDFLNVFIKPLTDWINDLVTKGLKSLADALFGIGNQVGGIFGGGSSAAGGVLGSVTGSGGTSSGGGAAGVAGGLFNQVTGAITAGASVADAILSHFGRKRAEATANAIEENTRTHMLLFADFRQSVGFFQNDELQEQTANLEYIVGNTDDMKGTLWQIRDALAGGIVVAGLASGLAALPPATASEIAKEARRIGEQKESPLGQVAITDLVRAFLPAPTLGDLTRSRTGGRTQSTGRLGTLTRSREAAVEIPTLGTPTRSRMGGGAQIVPEWTLGDVTRARTGTIATRDPVVTFGSFGLEDRQRILDLANEMGRIADIFGPGVQASAGAGLSFSQDISAFLDEIGFNDQAEDLASVSDSSAQIAELLANPLTVESPQLNASLLLLNESLQRPIIVQVDGREIARVVGDYQAEALPYA